MFKQRPGTAPRIPDGYLTVEDALGITVDSRAPFVLEHIASRRKVIRQRATYWGMPLERIASMLSIPLNVVEADIDYLAERGLI